MLTLSILKFLGFAVAAASTIWGLTQKTTTDDESGQRRLTTAGQVSIALALGSFLIAVTSFGFETLSNLQKVQNDALRLAREQAVAAERENRIERARQRQIAEVRLNALELRAAAAEQKTLLLAEATAEERRANAALVRDQSLSASVYAESRRNLGRTGDVLVQMERVLQPIGRPQINVEWQIGGKNTSEVAVLSDLRKLGRAIRNGDPQALSAAFGPFPLYDPASQRDISLGPSTDAFRMLDSQPDIHWAIRPFARAALVPSERALQDFVSTLPTWKSQASPLAKVRDYRFTLASDGQHIGYDLQDEALRFKSRLGEKTTIERETGNIISIPDLERSIVLLDIGASSKATTGLDERVRAAHLEAVPHQVIISAAGRIYRLWGSRFRRLTLPDGRSIFASSPIGPPTGFDRQP